MKKTWTTLLIGLVVFGLTACSGVGLKTKHQNEDSLITNQVETSLFHERSLRTSQIGVRTSRGIVQLSGVVEKAPDVATAMKITSGIPGVVEVENMLVAKQ